MENIEIVRKELLRSLPNMERDNSSFQHVTSENIQNKFGDLNIPERKLPIINNQHVTTNKRISTYGCLQQKPHIAIVRTDTEFLQEAKQKRLKNLTHTVENLNVADEHAVKRQSLYRKYCSKLKVRHSFFVSNNLKGHHVSVKNRYLNKNEMKSVLMSLFNDLGLTSLCVSGNSLQGKPCCYLIRLLATSANISQLYVDDCALNSEALATFSQGISKNGLTILSLSKNNISDSSATCLVEILNKCNTLQELHMNDNKLEGSRSRSFAKAIGNHKTLKVLDISWNHIRGRGCIAYAKIIENSSSLVDVNFSWNGFGYEGCAALSDALKENYSLLTLNLASNRVHPPALLELARGLCKNTSLQEINLSQNPIPASYTSVFLEFIRQSPEASVRLVIMERVVVDRKFKGILEQIQETRDLEVIYEMSLPVSGVSEEQMKKEIQAPSVFNVDPLKLLYMLKEKNRAQDFFRKINKDQDESLSLDELKMLFKEAGIPVSIMVIEKIIAFMDKDNDGKIDMKEFLDGDKKIRKMSRDVARIQVSGPPQDEEYNKYTRSFRKGTVDQLTYRLNVSESYNLLSPIESASNSNNTSPRSTPRKLSIA